MAGGLAKVQGGEWGVCQGSARWKLQRMEET
jgi:hypothetical protein